MLQSSLYWQFRYIEFNTRKLQPQQTWYVHFDRRIPRRNVFDDPILSIEIDRLNLSKKIRATLFGSSCSHLNKIVVLL